MRADIQGIKKYRLGFSPHGLALFTIIMLPNFIWFWLPAPHDILRKPSLTPLIDRAAGICQIGMAAALILIIQTRAPALSFHSKPIRACAVCIAAYYCAWGLYYCGMANSLLMMSLCLFPCMAFLCYGVESRNIPAFALTAVFTVLHVIYGAVNFILPMR